MALVKDREKEKERLNKASLMLLKRFLLTLMEKPITGNFDKPNEYFFIEHLTR
jgi:hypothetical protein